MFIFLLTFVALGQALIGVAAKTDALTKIPVGSSLYFNSPAGPTSWLSPSGRFAFGFIPDGKGFSIGINLYVSPKESPVVIWTAAGKGIKDASEGSVLSFTGKGFLLTPHEGASASTLIKFNGTESTGAVMLDNGNFMVYDSNPWSLMENCSSPSFQVGDDIKASCITWQTFDNPTDTMMGGQVLTCGTELFSRHSNTDHLFYKLSMQCDSNLVIYAIKRISPDRNTKGEKIDHLDYTPIWASQTYGMGYDTLLLGERGRFFLSTPEGSKYDLLQFKPRDNQSNMLYRAKLEPNKYFRLYQLNLRTNSSDVVYEVPTTNDDCLTGELCGVNSYCVVIKNRAECRCLPGFNFTDSNDTVKGCQKSFAEPSCWSQGNSDTSAFRMETLENLVWFDEAYSIVSAESKEVCSSACLAECDCEAALFFGQNCAKHKLPMSRATKGTNLTRDASTVYIKIPGEGSRSEAEENQKRRAKLVAVGLFVAIEASVFLLVSVAGAGGYWFFIGEYRFMWRKWELAFQEEVAPRSFSYEELVKATNAFAVELGRGGHATVFKGELTMYSRPNPVAVAVKRLGGGDENGERDFQAEIRIIGRAYHVNLVRLLGFCHESSNRLLVYEYMSRGSLADLICKPLESRPGWGRLSSILLGVARGIHYLHTECETKIIHRDIKPENILIAENWSVKITDFGISKLLLGTLRATTNRTSAPGTVGYVAPECVLSKGANVTEKSDVYSFGVVVLETVLWERNTVDNLLESARKFCEDMEEKRREKVDLPDANLEMEMMVKLGILCLEQNPDARPVMEDVILMLQGELAVPSPAAPVANTQAISSRKKVSWEPSLK